MRARTAAALGNEEFFKGLVLGVVECRKHAAHGKARLFGEIDGELIARSFSSASGR